MSSAVPEMRVPFNGVPLARLPKHVQAFTDCCDGAVFTGGIYSYREGRTTHDQVDLYRGGELVGRIMIERP